MEAQEQSLPAIKHFRVESPQTEGAPNPDVAKVNSYLKGLSAIETWKDEKFKKEIGKVRSDPSDENLQSLYNEALTVDNLTRLLRMIPNLNTLTQDSETREILPDEIEMVAENCLGADTGYLPPKDVYTDLEELESYTLNKVDELSTKIGFDENKIDPQQVHSFSHLPGNIWRKLSSISHDLVYPTSNIRSAVELLADTDPKNRDILLNIISESDVLLERTLDKSYGILSETYPKEEVSTKLISREIHSILTRKLRDEYGIDVVFMNSSDDVDQIGNVVWSKPWLATLFGNIAQNEAKAYRGKETSEGEKKVVRVWQNKVEPNNLQIVFEDEAGGIQDPKILAEGFGHGRGGWQAQEERTGKRVESTRIGMAEQADALKKYNGTITPQNYETADGKKGARIFINLPLV